MVVPIDITTTGHTCARRYIHTDPNVSVGRLKFIRVQSGADAFRFLHGHGKWGSDTINAAIINSSYYMDYGGVLPKTTRSRAFWTIRLKSSSPATSTMIPIPRSSIWTRPR